MLWNCTRSSGGKPLDQHAARDLDPDRFVGAVVEQEVERRLVEEAARQPAPLRNRVSDQTAARPSSADAAVRRAMTMPRTATERRSGIARRSAMRTSRRRATSRCSRFASRTPIGPQAVDSAAAAPAAAAAMPRSFAATASIPHAASPAAADDSRRRSPSRTPRGNEIQRASAPPVRTSAVDCRRRRRAFGPPREAPGQRARSRSRAARPASRSRPPRADLAARTRVVVPLHPSLAAAIAVAHREVAF